MSVLLVGCHESRAVLSPNLKLVQTGTVNTAGTEVLPDNLKAQKCLTKCRNLWFLMWFFIIASTFFTTYS
jgi:hypothetical protein